MKRLYLLAVLFMIGFSARAVTVTLYATGTTGSFTTGYGTAALRNDNIIRTTALSNRGYAVFDLSSIPTGATVSSCVIGFDVATYGGAGLPSAWNTYGWAGDLSTVTTPATLFADMIAGTLLTTGTYGTAAGNQTLPSVPATCTFVASHAGSKVSICFTGGGTRVYVMTGEVGAAATTGTHAPYLQITYTCTGVSGVSATPTPNPVCDGSTLTLTGAGTGTTSYLWTGPGGFTSTMMSPSFTAGPTAAGIYTLTAYNSGGCGTTVTSPSVVVNPATPPISGVSTVCASGGVLLLTDGAGAGTWTSSNTTAATVGSSTGLVTGVTPGTTTITFTAGTTGCSASAVVTVTTAPAPITGVTNLCVGDTTTLHDISGGGTGIWSSSNTAVATIGSTGHVTGVAAGTPSLFYTYGGCTVVHPMSINAAPVPITGVKKACPLTTTTLVEGSTGGTWSSSTPAIATVGSVTGVVTGVTAGIVNITYANGCGPNVFTPVTINPLPAPITGFNLICLSSTTTLADSTPSGMWSSSTLAIATVGTTGVVSGVALGTATISYTLPATGCYMTIPVYVNPSPAPITGPTGVVCQASTINFADAVSGGIWSSSTTSVASVGTGGVVLGVSMGTATITYTTGANCYLTRPVTVNPWAPIVGTDSVCVGSVRYLTDIVGGGTWSSTNLSVATVHIDSGKVSGLVAGTTTIIYLLPTGCSDTVSFGVIDYPPGITGPVTVCPGSSISLGDGTLGGMWTSDNSAIASVTPTSGVVTGAIADTVTIHYSIAPGCVVDYLITVNPLPAVINGNTILCPGTIDSLTDGTPGGLWSSVTPTLATVVDTSGIVTSLANGNATIRYTLPTGCSRTFTITILPPPAPPITYNWLTNTFFTDTGYMTYQWYDSATGLIPGATSPSLAALYTEYYYVVVTDRNGCKGASAMIHFNINEVGVGNLTKNIIAKVYPNPVSGTLHIVASAHVRAVISDIAGRREIEQPDAEEIDVSRLPDGAHMIALYDEEGNIVTMQKFIKE